MLESRAVERAGGAMLACVLLAGCGCGKGPPVWRDLQPLILTGKPASVDLARFVVDDRPDHLVFSAESGPEVIAEVDGSVLTVTPQPDWLGDTVVHLSVDDSCGNVVGADLDVSSVGATTTPSGGHGGTCAVTFTWVSPDQPDSVAVAGSFNDWSVDADEMETDGSGTWTLTKTLPAGGVAYKFVEKNATSFGSNEAWSCDPANDSIQCDAGYKDPAQIGFEHTCAPGATSCNSFLVVPACDPPRVVADEVQVDRTGLGLHLRASLLPGAAAIAAVTVTLDGAPADATVSDDAVQLEVSALSAGRHTVRVVATDADGAASDELYVPFWLDGKDWTDTVMYFAFLDRMRDGDPTNDAPTGATGADYVGGDVQGLIDLLPYLQDLGVSTLWVSNLQDNADEPWPGDCGLTYSGYHAYWPQDSRAVEEHFGDEALVHELIDQAHARGIRVLMDLVANHVHEDHPYYAEHPEWFNPYQNCKDYVDGQINFDRIPETCWFAEYLPDFDYSQVEPLTQLLDDAAFWAQTYDLDGFRIDAVKHMPYSVTWDLSAMVHDRFEHRDAGGDEVFYTVGETFDGADRIASYLGDHGLYGQFDFPLYYAIRNTFGHNGGAPVDALHAWDASQASFPGSKMSTFLGNHDVPRFVTDAWVGGGAGCVGSSVNVAPAPSDAWPYDRLKLAFSFLLTMPGVPLIYYGDELGLPGNADPDNRQPLEWYAGDLAGVQSVDDLAALVTPNQAGVLRHVRALTHARADHEALRHGTWTSWWEDPDLVAYSRQSGADHALVVLNRGDYAQTLTNGVAFAALPQGHYVDLLTGAGFDTVGDSLTITVAPRSSLVLAPE